MSTINSSYKLIDLQKVDIVTTDKLCFISKKLRFISNLKKIVDFFNSTQWKNSLEKTPEGHNSAYLYISELLKGNRVLFTDGENVLNDSGNLYSDLTKNEKEFIMNVDSNPSDTNLYSYGRLISMYIGSTVTIETSNGVDTTFDSIEISNHTSLTFDNDKFLIGSFSGITSTGVFYTTTTGLFQGTFTGTQTNGENSQTQLISSNAVYSGTFNGTLSNSQTGDIIINNGIFYGTAVCDTPQKIEKSIDFNNGWW